MTVLETPEQRWGSCPKPFNLTGETSAIEAFSKLSPHDIRNLQLFSKRIELSAHEYDVQPHLLLAGSAANLNSRNYKDLDLLVHIEPVEKRKKFAEHVISIIEAEDQVIVSSRGSLLLLRQLTGNSSGIYFRYTDELYNQIGVPFDVSFSDAEGGTYEDILTFHRINHLSFCELTT
jgi:hypothetical protein